MMDSQEVLSLYEAVAVLTDQMLTAARNSDWEQLVALELLCANHVETLKLNEAPPALSDAAREEKVRIIKKILADDREIRNLTQPWMKKLSVLMNSAGVQHKLSRIYGTNQPG